MSPLRRATRCAAIVAILAVAVLAPRSLADTPVHDACPVLLAAERCAALPESGGGADEACEELLAEPLCDEANELREQIACGDPAPAEACRLVARPLAPADAAMCAAAGASVTGGCLQWEAALPEGATPVGAEGSPDGSRVFVAGRLATEVERVGVWAFEARTGTLAWETSFAGLGGATVPADVAVSRDGTSIAVVGSTQAAEAEPFLLVLDAQTGATRWFVALDAVTGDADARHAAFSPDGGHVAFAAEVQATYTHYHCSPSPCTAHPHAHTDVVVAGFDAATGAIVLGHTVGQWPDARDTAAGVAVDDAGSLFVAVNAASWSDPLDTRAYLFVREASRLARLSVTDAPPATALGIVFADEGERAYVPFHTAGGVGLSGFYLPGLVRMWTGPVASGFSNVADWSASPDGDTVLISGFEDEPDGGRAAVVHAIGTPNATHLWQHRVPGAPSAIATHARAMGDGERVVALLAASRAEGATETRALVLDARSGALRTEHAATPAGFDAAFLTEGEAGNAVIGGVRVADGTVRGWMGAYDTGIATA